MTFVPKFTLDLRTAPPAVFKKVVKDFKDWAATQPISANTFTTGWHTITPEKAEGLLCRNPLNRAPRHSAIRDYANDMLRGCWKRTGQTIVLEKGGQLLDGQNRLWACYFSGSSFDTFIVADVQPEPKLFAYIDRGAVRTAKEALQTAGLNGASGVIAAAVNLVVSRFVIGDFKQGKLLPPAVLDYVERNPKICDVAHHVMENRRLASGKIGSAVAVFLGWKVFELHGLDTMDEFFALIEDKELDESHPAALYRAKLKMIEDDRAELGLQNDHRIIFFIKAFNAWKSGQTLKTLKIETREKSWPVLCSPAPETQAA